ncbi:unnamed protein product [Auanema sp. JU1783]|nr:unnamed protein product [Auanema sp. JU1783]
MTIKYLWVFPTLTFVFSTLAFIISTCLAHNNDHVGDIPFISDTGAQPPESCYFGLFLILSAICMGISMYLRHREIMDYNFHESGEHPWWNISSRIFLFMGYISVFGLILVATFQETIVIFVHYFGAFLVFTCGVIYLFSQTIFSYYMHLVTNRYIFVARTVITLMIVLLYPIGIYCVVVARPPEGVHGVHKWTSTEKNYEVRKLAAICEWLMAISFQIYILTLGIELKSLECHCPKLKNQNRSISSVSTFSESMNSQALESRIV